MGTESAVAVDEQRAEWLVTRRGGIGGSDAAAILGVHPWKTAIDVYAEKVGLRAEGTDNEAMWWGKALEPLIMLRYESHTGHRPTPWEYEQGVARHREHPCLIGTPDALVLDGFALMHGLEVKTANARQAAAWGQSYTDDVPQHYAVQCAHYMAVTGAKRWDVAALLGGSDFRVYQLMRDPGVEAWMVDVLTRWWERHVIGEEPPEVDGSESARRYVHELFPRNTEPLGSFDADSLTEAVLLHAAKRELAEAEGKVALHENRIKLLMGARDGLEGDGFRVTWKASRPGRTVDWERVARDIAARVGMTSRDMAEEVEAHATERPGARRFLFTRKEV